jgi:capsular polysaccharide biosynthesis protein
MSKQAWDLQRSAKIVRRRWVLVVVVAVLGVIGGGGFSVLTPLMVTSEALVVLPKAAPSIETEILVAASDPVLMGALPNVSPHMSLQKLQTLVHVQSVTPYVLSITATGATVAQAETTANAVAHSYVSYVGSAKSQGGRLAAAILQPASTVTGSSFREQTIIDALAGAAVGALIGVIAALLTNRTDRRLMKRDEIANSIGIPVLAAVPVARPTNAAGWRKLLQRYEPGAVHGLGLRQALQHLGMTATDPRTGSDNGGSSLTVLSLDSDPKAVALGPQLAVFAASMGIQTNLVIGPPRGVTTSAALRTACAGPPESSRGPAYLRVAVYDGNDANALPNSALTVVVATADSQNPLVAGMMRTTITVLGISAGGVTAEQLARTVSSAAADGREIVGILVADPDPTDHTTGRAPRPTPGVHRRAGRPTARLKTEIRR